MQGVTEDGQDGQRMSGGVGCVLEIETGGDFEDHHDNDSLTISKGR